MTARYRCALVVFIVMQTWVPHAEGYPQALLIVGAAIAAAVFIS